MNPGLIKRICLDIERGYNRLQGREEQAPAPRIYNEVYAKGFSNQPTLELPQEAPEKVTEKEPAVSKYLSSREIPMIQARRDAGDSFASIAADMAREGFTSSVGKPVTAHTVGLFLWRSKKQEAEGKKVPKEKITRVKASHDPILEELQDILTSNLADSLKRRFILALVKEKLETQ